MDKHLATSIGEEQMARIKVWDLPVRVFHWLLVGLVMSAWISSETGLTDIHKWTGYSILVLVTFRVLWGALGSQNARFSHFLATPARTWVYLKAIISRSAGHYDTHNPAGGWMVVALLLTLLIQVATGLFSNDEILFEGPFAPWVSSQWSEWLTELHEINFNILLALVGIHVVAVAWHELLGERLVKAMWHGKKESAAMPARQAPLWLAFVLLLVAGASVAWLISLAPAVSVGF